MENNMAQKTAMHQMLDELMAHEYTIPLELIVKCKELIEVEKNQMQQLIKIPTDEEITGKSLVYSTWYDVQKPFYNGAKWMLEHIIKINR
jgi:hypothetical protein